VQTVFTPNPLVHGIYLMARPPGSGARGVLAVRGMVAATRTECRIGEQNASSKNIHITQKTFSSVSFPTKA